MPPDALVRLLSGKRMRCSTEQALQDDIEIVLAAAGASYTREHYLGAATGRIDFMVGNTGLEIKVKGGARNIHRQCVRYCDHPSIDALVLATTRAVSLPHLSKPVFILDLSRAWL
ncbi:hypothetical protein [Methylorubrum populi]|uniref:Uncharacterized protein n=1 Tax=Methylorubrum populi TaxID=223967 RepID=A0A833MXR0_9HYPH|nr:hypothetical protein [Methylorubrum populi]KAB7783461.1 hypothetical protein F8B43_4023 [Methylorubrum populi]